MGLQNSEEALVKRAVRRDRQAFAALYQSCVVQVYRHVRYRVATLADAEDITQEVFIRAWKSIDKYKYKGAPFAAWLIAIAHNLVVDHYRAKKRAAGSEGTNRVDVDVDSIPQIDRQVDTDVVLDQIYVRKALSQLSEERQKVIVMRFIDGFSYAEIAQTLKKSEGAVRVIQYRALRELKEILKRS